MRKKNLAILLSKLESYDDPKADYEQYCTPGSVAAHFLYRAANDFNIRDKVVVDLGSGTGRLSIGASIAGADRVIGVEVDEDAVEVARRNLESIDDEYSNKIEFIVNDVGGVDLPDVDTVVQNPPFGSQLSNKNADKEFLKKAFMISDHVYSIHLAKEGVRNFLESFASDHDWGIDYREEVDFNIPGQYSFHRSENKKIKVDIYHLIQDL